MDLCFHNKHTLHHLNLQIEVDIFKNIVSTIASLKKLHFLPKTKYFWCILHVHVCKVLQYSLYVFYISSTFLFRFYVYCLTDRLQFVSVFIECESLAWHLRATLKLIFLRNINSTFGFTISILTFPSLISSALA